MRATHFIEQLRAKILKLIYSRPHVDETLQCDRWVGDNQTRPVDLEITMPVITRVMSSKRIRPDTPYEDLFEVVQKDLTIGFQVVPPIIIIKYCNGIGEEHIEIIVESGPIREGIMKNYSHLGMLPAFDLCDLLDFTFPKGKSK